MELAGSTGTLKEMPRAILQSCCKFPSAQGDCCSCFRQLCALISLHTEHKVEEGPTSSPLHCTVCMKTKTCAFQFWTSVFQMVGKIAVSSRICIPQDRGDAAETQTTETKEMQGRRTLLLRAAQASPIILQQCLGLDVLLLWLGLKALLLQKKA